MSRRDSAAVRFGEGSIPEPNSGCLLWIGTVGRTGYGIISVDAKPWRAHRFAWVLAHGPIPTGLQVLHRCDNPPCVNVRHLFLGTNDDNRKDSVAKGRNPRGSRVRQAKLTEGIVTEILNSNETSVELARRFGVSHTAVGYARNRITWRSVSPARGL